MSFIEQLKEIIADFHSRPLPTITRRDIHYEIVKSKVLTLTGVRRAGKTCFLFQIMHVLIESGLPGQNILYLNFEDERLTGITIKELSKILEAYFELYPSKKKELIYVFFDEIHNVEGWEKFIRRVQDNENVQIFVTGSSAKLLSREIATSLRGRCINYEIFPFSFREFLKHKNIKTGYSSEDAAIYKNEFNNYIKFGGFPEIIGCSEMIWRKILQDYIQLILYKDIIERHEIKNHRLMKYFIKHLLINISSPLSINKLFNDLKSQGFRVGKDTLHQYLDYIEDAYAFFSVPIFSNSVRTQQVNYKKMYCVDVGFSSASVMGIFEKQGAILENLVYLELRRNESNDIYYYKTTVGQEIDFLVLQRNNIKQIIQVCADIEALETNRREVNALEQAMDELGLQSSIIITRDVEDKIKKGGKEIFIVPFWKWAYEPVA